MSSKRNVRRKACGTKRRYKTQEEAMAAKVAVYRKFGSSKMAVYHCKFCGFFHFGHPNKRKKQSLKATRPGW